MGIRKYPAALFLVRCLIEAEADGYQQMLDAHPDAPIPDKWNWEGNTINMTFDDEDYQVVVTRKRKVPNT